MEISLKNAKVMIGMPAYKDIPSQTMFSLLKTQEHLMNAGIAFQHGFVLGCAVIEKARDEVVQLFLASDCTHLFWIDSDIVWEPEDFIRALAISTPMGICCGAYPAKIEEQVTFLVKTEGPDFKAGPGGLIEILGIGLGFFCIRREVVEAVTKDKETIWDDTTKAPRLEVFRVDKIDPGFNGTSGRSRSEDMAFCQDILDAGYKIYMDPEITLGHVGTKVYRGSIKDAINVE